MKINVMICELDEHVNVLMILALRSSFLEKRTMSCPRVNIFPSKVYDMQIRTDFSIA